MRGKGLLAPSALGVIACLGLGLGAVPAMADTAEVANFARNSLASPLVQSRTQMRIYKMDDPEDTACKDRKFVATELVVAPEVTETKAGPVRKWQEQWTLDRCGEHIGYRVFYTEIGQGGISLAVANADAAAQPPAATPITVTRVLSVTRPLMKGEDVRTVQKALIAAEFDVSADGIYGPNTRSAVIAFQKSKGLAADGQVGPKTLEALGL